MASTLQHLTIARRINDVYFNFKGNELSEFLLGSIVCDAPKKDITKKHNHRNKNARYFRKKIR